MNYIKRSIVIINEETGERKDFDSVNGAAKFLGVAFANVQLAGVRNSAIKGWRVFESPETIRKHIESLKKQLEILEGGE